MRVVTNVRIFPFVRIFVLTFLGGRSRAQPEYQSKPEHKALAAGLLHKTVSAWSSFVLSLFLATAFAVDLPPNAQTPTTTGFFRVDPATGTLTPLEKIKPVLEGSKFSYRIYLPGLASSTLFPYGEQHMFAIRLFGPPDLERERQHPPVLERLAPQKDGRYATKQFVPLEVATYGELLDITDARGKSHPTRTFLFTPRTPLEPGHYAFSAIGVLEPWDEYGYGRPHLSEVAAFTVARAMPTTQRPATPTAPIQSAPATSVEVIVPFAAGGAVDQIARIFLEGLAETWPGAVIVNRPGDGGTFGKNLLASAKPDGRTLAIVSGNESNANLARGLTPISMLTRGAGERIPSTYWQALVGPPGMDEQLVQRINRDALAALAKVRDKLSSLGLTVVGSSDGDFATFVAAGGGRLPEPSKLPK